MAETLDELTYDYEEDGILVRKQLDRVVLMRGGWVTIMFLFQELDQKSGTFRAPKIAIVRFRKNRGNYRKQSSFIVSSEKQARQIATVFDGWYAKMAAAASAGSNDDENPDENADADADADEPRHGGADADEGA